MAEQICSAIGSQDAQEGEEIRGQRGMVWSDIFLIVNGKSMETRDTGTLISLINVELGINVEGVQKLPNH